MTAATGATRRGTLALLTWSVPALTAAFIYLTQGRLLERGIAGFVALTVVLLAARRPDRSILILIVGLPFQGILLAQLYRWGVPAQVVRPLTSWKEALGLGVVVAGVRGYRASGRRLDRLDHLGFAYVSIVTVYALLPRLFAPGAPTATDVRSLGFRSSAGFVILLLATRHARLPADFTSRAARVVLFSGGVVAAIAIYEHFFSASWNRFMVDTVQYVRYQIDILKSTPADPTDIRRYGSIGGHRFLRSGSVFTDPTPAGFFLVLPFAVAVERRLRSGLRSGGATTFLILIGTGLLLTQTRAALVAGLVVVSLAMRPAAGRSTKRRIQFSLIASACLIIAVPAAASTGLNERVASTAQGQDQSSTDHLRSFWDGVDAITAAPLGHGLGTSAGIGQRFGDAKTTVTENGYLQVGVETGVLAMCMFCALTVLLVRRLRRTAQMVPDLGVSAVRGAATGLAVGAFLLHAWNEFAVAWILWGLAGASIGVTDALQPNVGVPGSRVIESA